MSSCNSYCFQHRNLALQSFNLFILVLLHRLFITDRNRPELCVLQTDQRIQFYSFSLLFEGCEWTLRDLRGLEL